MPSILNTPAAEIPIHFFRLPITQREILLVNILTDPVLYERILVSALYHNDPVFPQTITLFCNYVLICQMFAHLTIPRLPVHIAEAFDPALSAACSSVLILLVDRGLDRLLGTLPRDHLTNILRTILLSLSEELLQSFFLIVPFYFSLILIVYLLGEVDVITPILLFFSFTPYLPFASLTFLWT